MSKKKRRHLELTQRALAQKPEPAEIGIASDRKSAERTRLVGGQITSAPVVIGTMQIGGVGVRIC